MNISASINAKARAKDGLADIHIGTEENTYQLDLPFGDLYQRCGLTSDVALDFLITAGLCYLADKTVARSDVEHDNWTRELEVRLPVSDPLRWTRVAGDLEETLTFLTGDLWSLSFYKAPERLFVAPGPPPLILSGSGTKAVCLFSGGLDSLSGAIDLLSNVKLSKILLVGHYDGPGPRKVQSELASELARRYKNRFSIEHVRVAHRPEKAAEETLRSRSLVFIALGLYAAQAFGPDVPLYMFENGFIALNVPLTPSRRGSCSTRTMHPYFLFRLRSVIRTLGITNELINPYALKTKGECLGECKDRELLTRLAGMSVSCSHSSRRQDWVRRNAKNCGYCVPCICRRASLHKIGVDDGQRYGRDILGGELTVEDQRESANDLRAVTDFLREPQNPASMRKQLIAVARFSELEDYADMACRGVAEIKEWLHGTRAKSTANKYA